MRALQLAEFYRNHRTKKVTARKKRIAAQAFDKTGIFEPDLTSSKLGNPQTALERRDASQSIRPFARITCFGGNRELQRWSMPLTVDANTERATAPSAVSLMGPFATAQFLLLCLPLHFAVGRPP